MSRADILTSDAAEADFITPGLAQLCSYVANINEQLCSKYNSQGFAILLSVVFLY